MHLFSYNQLLTFHYSIVMLLKLLLLKYCAVKCQCTSSASCFKIYVCAVQSDFLPMELNRTQSEVLLVCVYMCVCLFVCCFCLVLFLPFSRKANFVIVQ